MIKLHKAFTTLRRLGETCGDKLDCGWISRFVDRAAKGAVIFDFGGVDAQALDGLYADAVLCFSSGLLKLPFSSVIFQVELGDKAGFAVKILGEEGVVTIHKSVEFFFAREVMVNSEGEVSRDGICPGIELTTMSLSADGVDIPECTYVLPISGGAPTCSVFESGLLTCAGVSYVYSGEDKEVITTRKGERATAGFLCLLMLLNTRGVETEKVPAPAKLNKARAKLGKVLIPEYHVVHIRPVRETGDGPGTGTHASPHAHYRRGHIRELSNGKKVWIKACIVCGNKGNVIPGHYTVGAK